MKVNKQLNKAKWGYTSRSIEKMISNHEDKSKELITFRNPVYATEALHISQLWMYNQANTEAINKYRSVTTFDSINKTLIVKVHNNEGNPISFMHRKIGDKYWVPKKGTHPYQQCLCYIPDEHGVIFVVEGIQNYLTGILLNSNKSFAAPFNVLMVPTNNYQKFNEFELNLLKHKDIYFLPDLNKNDFKCIELFTKLSEQIKDIANDTIVISLAEFLKENNDEANTIKLNLSKATKVWKDKDSYSFTNLLLYFCTEKTHKVHK